MVDRRWEAMEAMEAINTMAEHQTHAATHPPILIVDDDPTIRSTLRELFGDEGYATLEAPDGVAAMDALLLTGERLIVLLDLMMPRMTGWDVLSAVTEHEQLITRHAFIVMTANKYAAAASTTDSYFADLLARHEVPIVEKPFDLNELLGAVALSTQRLAS